MMRRLIIFFSVIKIYVILLSPMNFEFKIGMSKNYNTFIPSYSSHLYMSMKWRVNTFKVNSKANELERSLSEAVAIRIKFTRADKYKIKVDVCSEGTINNKIVRGFRRPYCNSHIKLNLVSYKKCIFEFLITALSTNFR